MALRLGFAWADARALHVGGLYVVVWARLRQGWGGGLHIVVPDVVVAWARGRGESAVAGVRHRRADGLHVVVLAVNALCATVRRREVLVGCLYRRGV